MNVIVVQECLSSYGTGEAVVNPSEIASVHNYNRMAEISGHPQGQSRIVMRDGRRIIVADSVRDLMMKISCSGAKAAVTVET